MRIGKLASAVVCLSALLVSVRASAEVLQRPVSTAAQSARESTIPPERLRLARELVQNSGADRVLVEAFKTGLKQAQATARTDESPDLQRIHADLRQFIENREEAYIPRIIEEYILVYAEEYNENELRDIIQFQSTSSGRMLMSSMSGLADELNAERIDTSIWPIPKEELKHLVDSALRTRDKKIALNITKSDFIQLIIFLNTDGGRAEIRQSRELEHKLVAFSQSMMTEIEHDRMERWCDLTKCTPRMRSWIDHPELPSAPLPSH